MSDALAEVIGLLREAMAGLQTLDARDPEATRAWAARHFAALVAVERALSRASSRPARDDAAIAVHELLVDALRGLAVEDDDPVGAVLGALMRISAARRGFVAVRRPDGALAFPSARSFSDVELGSPEAEVSRTILELAMRGGERPLQVDDASADARFAGQPSVQRLALRAVLVLPLVHAGRAFGVVYLDHPEEGATFDHRRREAAAAFVAAAAPRLEAALASAAAGARPSRLAELRRTHDLSGLVGDDPAVTAVVERLLALAPTDAPALIRGESGAGKRLLARLLHRNSRRARGPWVELRCAADPWAPREALAAARGGTLLLDGVDALPFERQTLLAAEIDRELRKRAAEEAEVPA